RLRSLPQSAAHVLLLAALDDAADVGGDVVRGAELGGGERSGTEQGSAQQHGAEPGDTRQRGTEQRGVQPSGAGQSSTGQRHAEHVLGAIEASGLARWDAAGRLVFRHPLVRSAVIAAASQAERR
ncbi:hypothetical protein G3I28_26560, partial [Streptomyces sp. SID10116]|nr:hypothetical protein [Streptomyces sp. SID10116]